MGCLEFVFDVDKRVAWAKGFCVGMFRICLEFDYFFGKSYEQVADCDFSINKLKKWCIDFKVLVGCFEFDFFEKVLIFCLLLPF